MQFSILKCTRRKYFYLPTELGSWNSKRMLSLPSYIRYLDKKLKFFWKPPRKSRRVQFSILKCTRRKYFNLPNDLGSWNSKLKFSFPSFIRKKIKKLKMFENLREIAAACKSILKCTRRKYFYLPTELGSWSSKRMLSLPSYIRYHQKKLKKFENLWEKAVVCNLVY